MNLDERMALTVPGQVTWADPSKGKKCISCAHCAEVKHRGKAGTHFCKLVKSHTGKRGLAFNPHNAVACSVYAA